MNRTACAVSSTLWEKEPSPQSPSESPSPRLSKRSIPTPSLASCLQIRLVAGLSLPRVKPWENTPQPRAGAAGSSIRPASLGPLVLGNQTRSATWSSFESGDDTLPRAAGAGEYQPCVSSQPVGVPGSWSQARTSRIRASQ